MDAVVINSAARIAQPVEKNNISPFTVYDLRVVATICQKF